MSGRHYLHFALLAICACWTFADSKDFKQRAVDDDDDYIAVSDTGLKDEFDWQLLKILNTQNNVILSPISLKILLALLYEGASGVTKQEIQLAMRFNQDEAVVRQEFSKIVDSLSEDNRFGCDQQQQQQGRARNLRKTEPYTLNFGTRIFLDRKMQPQQLFQSKACEKYNTLIEATDFNNSAKAADAINEFVHRVTLGKIDKLVQADDLRDEQMLLVNALYFRGYWTHQFPRNQTHTGGFYLNPQRTASVDYMATTNDYFYIESRELDAKMIRIPYKGKKYAMVIILPNAKAGLSALIQRLDVMRLKQLMFLMDRQSVDLVLPKFKFDFQSRMSETLKSMGMVSMFQQTASLPGITRGNEFRLAVSDVIQKSGIEVNEEGSTAFAASDIHIGNKFGDAQASFNATHPFAFFIEDQVTHTILFMGKVVNPLESVSMPLPSRFGDGDARKYQL